MHWYYVLYYKYYYCCIPGTVILVAGVCTLLYPFVAWHGDASHGVRAGLLVNRTSTRRKPEANNIIMLTTTCNLPRVVVGIDCLFVLEGYILLVVAFPLSSHRCAPCFSLYASIRLYLWVQLCLGTRFMSCCALYLLRMRSLRVQFTCFWSRAIAVVADHNSSTGMMLLSSALCPAVR